MTRGKKKCELLKTIRCQVAKKNGIPYTYTECTYQGECRGTCPKCEEELRYLTRELEKIKQSGKQVAVAGVATAVIATSATGCFSESGREGDSDHYVTQGVPAYTRQEELDGEVAYTPEPEETEMIEIMGDMLEYVTPGEPLPPEPEVSEVAAALLEGVSPWGMYRSREELRLMWSEYLAEQGENYDVFVCDESKVKVTYDVRGRTVWVSLPGQEEVPAMDLRGDIPHVWNVIQRMQEGTSSGILTKYCRDELWTEWTDELVESCENYDVFAFLGVYLKVTYHEDGFADLAEVWEGYTPGENSTEDAQ